MVLALVAYNNPDMTSLYFASQEGNAKNCCRYCLRFINIPQSQTLLSGQD